MIISGSKSVKKGQKMLNKATNWTYIWVFDKKFLYSLYTLVSTTSGARPEVASLPASPPPFPVAPPSPLLPPVGPEYRSAFKL